MSSPAARVSEPWPLEMHFQPIVDLGSGFTVAFEALARETGPDGPQPPAEMFARARQQDRLVELDRACRSAALQSAAALLSGTSTAVFVNTDPAAAASAADELDAAPEPGSSDVVRVLEVTERSLAGHVGSLLTMVERARACGWRIAVDDVGAQWASLALLPFLRPDVIKLDLRLVQERTTVQAAEVVNAVAVQAAGTGALVLAEGIETEQQRDLARSMGATLGQGYLLGRPAPLPARLPVLPAASWPRLTVGAPGGLCTPFQRLPAHSEVRRSTKPLLVGMSRWLERQAFSLGEPAVVLATFERAGHFTARTARRYADLAASAAVVGVFGQAMPAEPAPGVRGVDLSADDPLCPEWDVIVVGPHFTGALLARDLGDDAPDDQRRFDYAVTYDRDLVLAAAGDLLRRLPDLPDAPIALDLPPRTATSTTLAEPASAVVDRPVQALPHDAGWLLDGAADDVTRLLGSALAVSSNGLVVCDAALPDLPMVYVNPAFVRISGHPADALLGRNARMLQTAESDPQAVQVLSQAVRTGREVRVTVLNARPDGTRWWNEMHLVPVHDRHDQLRYWVGTQNDVTARVHAQEQASYLAAHDPLTGLANRRHLTEHLPAEIGRAGRNGTSLGLLFLDLDGFKAVNDVHGHTVGDALLIAVAARLRGHVRVGDLLVRQGGDEFLVVLSGLPSAQADAARAAREAADKLRTELRRPFRVDGLTVHLTTAVSVGVSLWPHDAGDGPTMIDHADTALYRVKSDGRDGTSVYTPG